MIPRDLLHLVIRPTLAWLGPPYDAPAAAVMLLAIAGQESAMTHRRQLPTGPARSWWQIEPPTAKAVWTKWPYGRAKLEEIGWEAEELAHMPHYCLRWSEVGACVLARGILWLDAMPLPEIGDEAGAWACYADRCWRPGKPHPETWAGHYASALSAMELA